MLRSKTILLFLLQAFIIYGLLSLPFSVYDDAYGNFYRKMARSCFGEFRDNGFVKFSECREPKVTLENIGNYTLVHPDGSAKTATDTFNTRYLGYIPTILLISLVLASPVPWKRRLISLAAGLILVTLLILFKHWLRLLWLCNENTWLQLTNFTDTNNKLFNFIYNFISVSSSTVLYFVVAIWLLVTFRAGDFKE